MKKNICIAFQLILLAWFFLDMTGLSVGNKCLVTRSYKEDGIFFVIYLFTFLLFLLKEKIGKWLVTGWLAMWFITQFLSHEWYTIFGSGFMGSVEGKINYFSDTIHWITFNGRYFPDVYHTVLHLLILSAFISTVVYIKTDTAIPPKMPPYP